jgi:hypothetical protein
VSARHPGSGSVTRLVRSVRAEPRGRMQLRPAPRDDGERSRADLDVSLPRLPASDRQRVRDAGAVAEGSGRRHRTVYGVRPHLGRLARSGRFASARTADRRSSGRPTAGRTRSGSQSARSPIARSHSRPSPSTGRDGIRGCPFRTGSRKSTTSRRVYQSARDGPRSSSRTSASNG